MVEDLSNEEFNNLVDKLIEDNSNIFSAFVAIYPHYSRNKIIDYYIDKENVDMLLGFLDYCNDFDTKGNPLNQKYVVDRLIQKNDKQFINDILESNFIYLQTYHKKRDY